MIDKFKQFLSSRSRSPITIAKYTHAVEDFAQYLQTRGLKLSNTTPVGALEGFVTWLGAERGLSPASIHQETAGLSMYFKFAKTMGYELPEFIPPTMPKVPKRLPLVLQQQHLDVYLKLACNVPQPYSTALLLLPFCGLRVNEVTNIKLGDLSVRKNDQGKDRFLLNVIGKGNKQRITPIFSNINNVLLKYASGWFKQYIPLAKVPEPSRWLFPDPSARTYRPLSRQKLEQMVSTMRPEVGLRGLKPHTLRATYLTGLLSLGIPMHEAARYAGHGNIQVLYDHYAGNSIQNAAAIFGDVYRLV